MNGYSSIHFCFFFLFLLYLEKAEVLLRMEMNRAILLTKLYKDSFFICLNLFTTWIVMLNKED